jgi:aminoglycoside 6'-N-acetyltransferase I
MNIRAYRPSDRTEWLRMRRALWPDIADGNRSEEADADNWLAREDAVLFVAERSEGEKLAGFAEVGERDYADGCDTSPVVYLEGWYVDPDLRRQGVGAALIRAVEAWARSRNHTELASDALLENTPSQQAHTSLGFEEVERAVRYRKPL